jgi:hypothetical protein
MMDNFKFFALHYLNDWYGYDRRFVEGLRPSKDRAARLVCIREAVKYYTIARNFKARPGEEKLASALAALDNASREVTQANVDATVCALAETFQGLYGKYLISAASKLLWLRHQSPVIIYDSRALACLNVRCSKALVGCTYAVYRREWLRQFHNRESEIRAASKELARVKDFSIAPAMTHHELMQLVSNEWFHHRVFDKFLWWNSNDEVEAQRCDD